MTLFAAFTYGNIKGIGQTKNEYPKVPLTLLQQVELTNQGSHKKDHQNAGRHYIKLIKNN